MSKLAVLIVAAMAALVASAAPDRAADPSNVDQVRAALTYGAMQRYFYRPSSALYSATYPRGRRGRPSELWPFSQALAATVSMAALPATIRVGSAALFDRLRGLRSYWNPRLRPPGYEAIVGANGEQYYDDNAWIGLELLRVNALTGDRFALRRAERIFALLVSGWDGDERHPCAGGVYWTRKPEIRDRNTVSTANAAQLGAALYRRTGRPNDLAWARTMYAWVSKCLLGPNGLYSDHLDVKGVVDPKQWSYNQGAMVAAGVRLFQATGQRAYLEQAERVADAAIAAYTPFSTSGEPPYFLAIFFDDLALLASVDPTRDYSQAVREYGDAVAASALDSRTGLVRFGKPPVKLLEQAAIVRIYAGLARRS